MNLLSVITLAMVSWGEWCELKNLPQATEQSWLMTQQNGQNEAISEVEHELFGHLMLH